MRRLVCPLFALAVCASALPAQTPPDTIVPVPESATQDTSAGSPVTPTGAFLRSLAVPAWGQAALGSHFRGGVYLAAQAGSGYMVWKSHTRVRAAQDIEQRRSGFVLERLLADAQDDPQLAERIENPDTLAFLIRSDPGVTHARLLAEARKQHREDWITWTIFWTLASAIDAYVAAHLADFPAGIAIAPAHAGGVLLSARLDADVWRRRGLP